MERESWSGHNQKVIKVTLIEAEEAEHDQGDTGPGCGGKTQPPSWGWSPYAGDCHYGGGKSWDGHNPR